jgi:hypothetical protein
MDTKNIDNNDKFEDFDKKRNELTKKIMDNVSDKSEDYQILVNQNPECFEQFASQIPLLRKMTLDYIEKNKNLNVRNIIENRLKI